MIKSYLYFSKLYLPKFSTKYINFFNFDVPVTYRVHTYKLFYSWLVLYSYSKVD